MIFPYVPPAARQRVNIDNAQILRMGRIASSFERLASRASFGGTTPAGDHGNFSSVSGMLALYVKMTYPYKPDATMKKSELVKLLQRYDDDQEVLVEAADGGFDDTVVYITAVRGRRAQDLTGLASSDYMHDNDATGFGALVLGTAGGLMRLH